MHVNSFICYTRTWFYCWQHSDHAGSLPCLLYVYAANKTFCYLINHSHLYVIAVCHHWWARYLAACYWPVEENTFKGAAGPTGKAALEKLELQSSEWEGFSGVDFLAVIPVTYSKMGWYTADWLPSSFCWGLSENECHPLFLSWLI